MVAMMKMMTTKTMMKVVVDVNDDCEDCEFAHTFSLHLTMKMMERHVNLTLSTDDADDWLERHAVMLLVTEGTGRGGRVGRVVGRVTEARMPLAH